jgi:hypothetical protein
MDALEIGCVHMQALARDRIAYSKAAPCRITVDDVDEEHTSPDPQVTSRYGECFISIILFISQGALICAIINPLLM